MQFQHSTSFSFDIALQNEKLFLQFFLLGLLFLQFKTIGGFLLQISCEIFNCTSSLKMKTNNESQKVELSHFYLILLSTINEYIHKTHYITLHFLMMPFLIYVWLSAVPQCTYMNRVPVASCETSSGIWFSYMHTWNKVGTTIHLGHLRYKKAMNGQLRVKMRNYHINVIHLWQVALFKQKSDKRLK